MSIPGIFRKEYTEKQLQKKLLKRLYIKEDRDYVASLFTKDPKTGKFVCSAQPDKKAQKRLKALAKAVKKNKGLFVAWKLALVLVLAGGIVVFNIVFKNRIAERFAEKGLSTVFGAPVDIRGMEVHLFQGRSAFASMEIGDSKTPGKNLFQTGRGAFDISTGLALRKKLVISDASLLDIQTGTDSTIPLRAWDKEQRKKDEADPDDGRNTSSFLPSLPAMPDFSQGFEDFDYRGLIEAQKENLPSIKALEQIQADGEALVAKWDEKLAASGETVESVSARARRLSSTDLSDLKDINKLTYLQKDLENGYREVQTAVNDAQALRTQLINDKNAIIRRKNNVSEMAGEDYRMLKDLVLLPAGEKADMVSAFASSFIAPELAVYYGYVRKGLAVLHALKADKNDKESESGAEGRRYQQFISFPINDYPDVLISRLETSFAGAYEGLALIENISSDPELAGAPVTVNAALKGDGWQGSLDASADLRENREALGLNFSVDGLGFSLDEGLEGMTIQSLKGNMKGTVSADLSGGYENGRGVLSLVLQDSAIVQTKGGGMVHDTIGGLFAEPVDIDVQGSFDVKDAAVKNLRVSSGFDKVLSQRIGAYLKDQAAQMEAKLRSEVRTYLKERMKEYAQLDTLLSGQDAEALAQVRSVNDAKNLLENKKKEAEAKVKAISDEASRRAREAEEKAREEADRLKREAEERAEDEAKKLKDKVKIPGF
ncbi:MAG: hypothetical protein JXB03_03615 [Spirochaetales bacterium]|nr:hypothetical protein [Spirochaetales bacterium]